MLGVGLLGFALWLAGPGWVMPGVPAAQARDGLQPFERAGDSFPGSAFYYLASDDTGMIAPDAAKSAWDAQLAQIHGDDAAPITGTGPAARPMFARGNSLDQGRALQCLTAAIYYEAASEPDAGQRAVAQVVLNRVAHPAWPNTVCGVVYQGSERPSCQFSFACDGSLARKPMAVFWERARRVAADALAGAVYAPVGLATHYHTSAVHPYWADSLNFIGTIGAHRFYRWQGAAGRPTAFNAVYAGGEPVAAPHPRTWTPAAADVADPITLEKAFEAGRIEALKTAQAAPLAGARNAASFGQTPLPSYGVSNAEPRASGPKFAPAVEARGGDALYRAGQLPGGSAVNPAYENAGKWIAQPGG
ncbi:cell wall hydrolase [Novosphingobium sp. PASSN1]|uniref:cell wall hydrolase n=1 Tax=Novosphingobium sp. PASSN1 TaxID=2015561 RepID=UPI0025DDA511|nr:cell wall hydrolase [Novosphingobium sp. PASSN1]